jgi:hypothetical protein
MEDLNVFPPSKLRKIESIVFMYSAKTLKSFPAINLTPVV